jgi:plastocyanin
MNTFITKIKIAALLCGITGFYVMAVAGEMKDTGGSGAGQNKIEIKDFAFNPQKQFKKSTALDTDQQFTITAGAPGTYTYFCSVHPKMTGTIVVVKP